MVSERVVVAISTPLADELVARVRAVDDRIEVRHEPDGAEVLLGLPDRSPGALAEVVRANPGLSWVQVLAEDADEQVRAAGLTDRELGRVTITSATDVHAVPLAEFAVFGILAFTKGLPRLVADGRAHRWGHHTVAELAGSTVLVVGLGPVGVEVARLAKAFGMRVLAVNRNGRTDCPYVDEIRTARFLGDLLPVAHSVVLTLPSTEQTRGLIGSAAIGRMHSGAVVVDVSGGGVLDEAALVQALQQGKLAGAALDVFATEPLPADSPLWDLPNVLISPHTAGRSEREDERVVDEFIENLRRYLAGTELHDTVTPTGRDGGRQR
ncbi:MAG: D-2-hydroxyacid dehydrogenase [Nocardioides sp.]